MPFAIKPKQTILFTGDSITDCGRRGEHFPIGAGYVRMVRDLLDARYPAHRCRVLNTGVGGDTVRRLFDRWTDDCIALKPDWLSVMVGINDISGHLSNAANNVGPEEFETLYDTILTRVRKETRASIVLMTPFQMSQARPTEADGWRGRIAQGLPSYIAAVERMAKRHRARLVRTHDMFQAYLAGHSPYEICAEPVHPNASGHLLLAHEWLRTVGW